MRIEQDEKRRRPILERRSAAFAAHAKSQKRILLLMTCAIAPMPMWFDDVPLVLLLALGGTAGVVGLSLRYFRALERLGMNDDAVWLADGASPRAMIRSLTRQMRSGRDYGLGLIVFAPTVSGGLGRGLGHTGEYPFYRTAAFDCPDADVTLVVETNEERVNAETISIKLMPLLGARHRAASN